MIADPPNSWGDWQGKFRRSFEIDPAALSRTPVHWRFTEADPPSTGGWCGLIGMVVLMGSLFGRLLRRRPVNDQPVLAVWLDKSTVGTPAELVFAVRPRSSMTEGDGELVGSFAPNGTLCVETSSGEVLWPVYNPVRPSRWVSRR